MKEKLIAILIPTYNRVESLMINLKMLEEYIEKLNCYEDVKIVISDNHSTDETYALAKGFFDRRIIDHGLFRQEKNIGLEQNAVFCLNKSNARYSMFLGDDDYLDFSYFERVLNYLKNDNSITCIIPNFYPIDTNFSKIGGSRDLIKEDQVYSLDNNRLDLMFKAHQLSGLLIKTEKTLDSYLNKGGGNIYPFMYFAAFNIKRGKTIHISECPVKVTVTNTKDWGYGNDGLITEILQNIAMIAQTEKEKFALEKHFLKINKWRYLKYVKNPLPFLKIVFTSKRYSVRLRWYIVWRFIADSPIIATKRFIKSVFRIFGYEIKKRKIIKKRRRS